MIVLFTDFGLEGPYQGQVKAVLVQQAPGVPVVDLFADAPVHDPELAAYLLPAYAEDFPAGTVFLCVVDPEVGTAARRPAVVKADGRWYVGPDNGLFELVARRAETLEWWAVTWRPPELSASFHGRDLFAPVAARLARGEPPPGERRDPSSRRRPDWPDDLAKIVYIDRFGNAMTGIRAATLGDDHLLEVGGRCLRRARTFAEVPEGEGFWYENANGLAEVAVNRGRADACFGLELGTPVFVREEPVSELVRRRPAG